MSGRKEVGPSDHVHVWEPIPNWYGRYVCTVCQAIGYRAIVTAAIGYRAIVTATKMDPGVLIPYGNSISEIRPYACAKKGCTNPATSYNPKRSSEQRCKDHLK